MNTQDNDKPVYVLLKDLPDCKAGVEYRQTDDGENYICYDNLRLPHKWSVAYSKAYVENNEEWFQKKESKSIKEQPIEITITKDKLNAMMENVFNAARLTHPLAGTKYDTFKDYYNSLPENQHTNYNAQTKYAEQQPLLNKEYEIVSYYKQEGTTKTIIHMESYGRLHKVDTEGLLIHSVRRSDGEIFIIKEEVNETSFHDIETFVIESFEETKHDIRVVFEDNACGLIKSNIICIKKIPKPEPSTPLFTEQEIRDLISSYKNESGSIQLNFINSENLEQLFASKNKK